MNEWNEKMFMRVSENNFRRLRGSCVVTKHCHTDALVLVYSQKIHHHYPLFLLLFCFVGTKNKKKIKKKNKLLALCLCWNDESRRQRRWACGLKKRVKECTHVYASCEESVSVNSRLVKIAGQVAAFQSIFLLHETPYIPYIKVLSRISFAFLKNNKLEL